jgi:hypothetical protein
MNIVPPLTLGGGTPDSGATGGGDPAALTNAYQYMTDPMLAPSVTTPPNLFTPTPDAPSTPLQLNGLGPISGAVNPWLADPTGVAGDEQRRLDLGGSVDPGVQRQQTIIHAPEVHF